LWRGEAARRRKSHGCSGLDAGQDGMKNE
jgi:hypothetical protein